MYSYIFKINDGNKKFCDKLNTCAAPIHQPSSHKPHVNKFIHSLNNDYELKQCSPDNSTVQFKSTIYRIFVRH